MRTNLPTITGTALLALFLWGAGATFAADSGGGQSNWEKFKDGAKQAGSAVADSTKSAAQKTGSAVSRGAKKTGEFFADGYEDVKDYVEEKTDENPQQPQVVVEPAPLPEPVPVNESQSDAAEALAPLPKLQPEQANPEPTH